jgi:hypothetical protein
MVYNLCALPVAAGALYPRYRLQLPPWLAVRDVLRYLGIAR